MTHYGRSSCVNYPAFVRGEPRRVSVRVSPQGTVPGGTECLAKMNVLGPSGDGPLRGHPDAYASRLASHESRVIDTRGAPIMYHCIPRQI